jgi:hypothetical protein
VRQTMSLGSTAPSDERCAQTAEDDYATKARAEGKRFINGLIWKFGEPPFGAMLMVKGFNHDFGTYYEVVVAYDDQYDAAVKYAWDMEENVPATWDELGYGTTK